MHQHYIDSFTLKQFCEEYFDGFTEVMHGALLHDFVHCPEHIIFIDNLSKYSIIQSIEVDSMNECLLENLVAHWT